MMEIHGHIRKGEKNKRISFLKHQMKALKLRESNINGVIFYNNFVIILQDIYCVHCMGEENHMRMLPSVFTSITSSPGVSGLA